jgi:hypothetical protein
MHVRAKAACSENGSELARTSPSRGARRKRAFAPYGLERSPLLLRVTSELQRGTLVTDGLAWKLPELERR